MESNENKLLDEAFKKRFAENLTYFLKERDKTQADLYKHMNVSSAVVSNWCTGKKLPRMDKIQSICNFLGIEKSDLLEDRQEKAKKDEMLKRAAQYLDAMTDQEQMQALDYLKYLADKQ